MNFQDHLNGFSKMRDETRSSSSGNRSHSSRSCGNRPISHAATNKPRADHNIDQKYHDFLNGVKETNKQPTQQRRRARYATGGHVNDQKQAKKLERMGRNGDTQLVHVNKQEERMLKNAGGRGSVNPKTGLREYVKYLKNTPVTRSRTNYKQGTTPKGREYVKYLKDTPMIRSRTNYKQGTTSKGEGTCGLHTLDSILHDLAHKSNLSLAKKKKIVRRNSVDIVDDINKNKSKNTKNALYTENEFENILPAAGLSKAHFKTHLNNLPNEAKIAYNKGNSIAFDGISRQMPGTKSYNKLLANNITKGNTDNSHQMRITRVNLYEPKKASTTGRKGSLDFINSNEDTGKAERGLITNNNLVIPTATTTGKQMIYSSKVPTKIPGQDVEFNLQDGQGNRLHEIKSQKAVTTLSKNKRYPFT